MNLKLCETVDTIWGRCLTVSDNIVPTNKAGECGNNTKTFEDVLCLRINCPTNNKVQANYYASRDQIQKLVILFQNWLNEHKENINKDKLCSYMYLGEEFDKINQ